MADLLTALDHVFVTPSCCGLSPTGEIPKAAVTQPRFSRAEEEENNVEKSGTSLQRRFMTHIPNTPWMHVVSLLEKEKRKKRKKKIKNRFSPRTERLSPR